MPHRSAIDIHHQLLNLIAVMSSNAELLTDTGLSDEQAEIVVDIIGAGQEARLVIQRLGGLVDPVGT